MSLLPTSIPANSTAAIHEAQNSTNGSDCSQLVVKEWIVTVMPVYFLVISVVGIVFNVFVLMVFCLHKKSCTVAEIYLSNLAAADLCLVSSLPFWAVNLFNRYNWIFGRFLCKVILLSINSNIYCSMYSLVLVCIDRYLAVVHPMSHNRMRRPKFAKLSCVLVWSLALLLGVPALIYRDVKSECNSTLCHLAFPSETQYSVYMGVMIFSFIIPIPIISYCTVKIIQALNNRLMEGLRSQKMENKATILVLVVLLAFLISWVPYLLQMVVEFIINAGDLRVDITTVTVLDISYQIFTCLAYFNSALNPILYVIVGKNFQEKVKDLMKWWNCGVTSNMTSLQSKVSTSITYEDGSSGSAGL